MRALREFRYTDFDQGRSVRVKRGEQLDVERLAANRVDLDKLQRTKFITGGEESVAPTDPRETLHVRKRRGRPPKASLS